MNWPSYIFFGLMTLGVLMQASFVWVLWRILCLLDPIAESLLTYLQVVAQHGRISDHAQAETKAAVVELHTEVVRAREQSEAAVAKAEETKRAVEILPEILPKITPEG